MTPANLAKAECANWNNGACLGACINGDLSHAFARPLPICVLIEPVERCAYFEEYVIPATPTGDDERPAIRYRASRQEAIESYLDLTTQQSNRIRSSDGNWEAYLDFEEIALREWSDTCDAARAEFKQAQSRAWGNRKISERAPDDYLAKEDIAWSKCERTITDATTRYYLITRRALAKCDKGERVTPKGATERACPKCGKNFLPPRMRMCEECRLNSKKKTKSDAMQKWRKLLPPDVEQLSKNDA